MRIKAGRNYVIRMKNIKLASAIKKIASAKDISFSNVIRKAAKQYVEQKGYRV